jgi:hypothetical protein
VCVESSNNKYTAKKNDCRMQLAMSIAVKSKGTKATDISFRDETAFTAMSKRTKC